MGTEGMATFETICGITWGLYLIIWHFHTYITIHPFPTTLNKVITIFLMVKCLYHLSVSFYLRLDIDSKVNYYDMVSTTLFSVYQTMKYTILLLISKGYQVTRVRFDRSESGFLVVSIAIIYLSFSCYNIEKERAFIIILALLALSFFVVSMNSLTVIRSLNLRLQRQGFSMENREKKRIMNVFFCCSSVLFVEIILSQLFFHYVFRGYLITHGYEIQVNILDKGTELCCLGTIFFIFRANNRNWIATEIRNREEEDQVIVPYYKALKAEQFVDNFPLLVFKGHDVLVLGTRRNEEQAINSSSSPLNIPLLG